MTSLSFLRDLSRAARWHRRLLAGAAAAAAVYFGLTSLAPAPPPTVSVLAAARDLPGGAVPGPDDLRSLELPADTVPSGVLGPDSDLAGRVLSGPVRSGEPLTDARFLGPGLVPPGSVAYPFRIDDAAVSALLRVGDRIDLYAGTSTAAATAGRIARAVQVIALPASRTNGALIVVSVSPAVASKLAQATTNARISVALTPDTS